MRFCAEQEAIAGMNAKSAEFRESGGKVYLPEPVRLNP